MPRVRYTLEQRVFMYDAYVKSGSARKVRRRFRRKFQDVSVPHRETVHRIVNKVRATGSLLDRKPELKRRVLTEEKLDEIGARLEHSPRKSLRCLAQETGVSITTVRTATKLLKQPTFEKVGPVVAGPPRGRGGEGRGDRRGGRGPPGGIGYDPRGDSHGLDPRGDHRNPDYHGEPPRRIDGQPRGPIEEPPSQQAAKPSIPAKPLKGIPAVVPDFVIPNNKESPTGAAPGPKFPEPPNLMQKLSEMTGGADTSVDNIISKGKELIFMKFGLGGSK